MKFTVSVADPGVPYNITVRASTAAGKGEAASIVVFSVQEGNIDLLDYVQRIVMCHFCLYKFLLCVTTAH